MSTSSIVHFETRVEEVSIETVLSPRVKAALHKLAEGAQTRVRQDMLLRWYNESLSKYIPRQFRYPDAILTDATAGAYRVVFHGWIMQCMGYFEAPATHITFHYDVWHELNDLRINRWDAHKAYKELFYRPVKVADSVLVCDVARRILHDDNSFLSENTLHIIKAMCLDYCRRRTRSVVSLEELTFLDDDQSIEIYGTWAKLTEVRAQEAAV
jgi:hypothetical protein